MCFVYSIDSDGYVIGDKLLCADDRVSDVVSYLRELNGHVKGMSIHCNKADMSYYGFYVQGDYIGRKA